jgi:5-methylcytosine-specific restriction enzyme A
LLPPLDAAQRNLFVDDVSPPHKPPDFIPPLFEGTAYQIELTAFERNPEARCRCIEHYGPRCVACEFDFGATYGAVASGFIHVHHLVPLSEIGEAYVVDPIADLNPLCPNCHAVAHLRTPPYTIENIKAFLAAH